MVNIRAAQHSNGSCRECCRCLNVCYHKKRLVTTNASTISHLGQGNFLPSLQIFDLPRQIFPFSLGYQVLARNRCQLLIGQLAHKFGRKNFDWSVMTGYKEVIRSLHADNVDKTLPRNLIVGVEYVVKVVDCVLEITTGVDALIENGVELDHFSLVRVPYARFPVSNCTFGARFLSYETSPRSSRGCCSLMMSCDSGFRAGSERIGLKCMYKLPSFPW